MMVEAILMAGKTEERKILVIVLWQVDLRLYHGRRSMLTLNVQLLASGHQSGHGLSGI